MPSIGDIQQNEQGIFKLTADGWTQISPEQAQAESAPAASRFVAGAIGLGAEGEAGALGNMAGLGGMFGLPLAGLARFGARKAGSLLGKGRMADRVNPQAAADNAERLRRQLGGDAPLAKGQLNAVDGDAHLLEQLGGGSRRENVELARGGMNSVGAAEVQGIRESIAAAFTAPADLTAAQSRAIPVAEGLGFKFLPGQVQGSKLFLEGIKSDPILRGAVEWELGQNRRGLQRAAGRAVGLSDDTVFDADAMGMAASELGAGFEGIGQHIGKTRLNGALVDDIAPLLSSNQRRAMGISGKDNAHLQLDNGTELMEIRSRLMQQSSDAWRRGESVVADDINNHVAAIDKVIDKVIPASVREQWRRLQGQWRIFRVLEKPNVVDLDTGNINFITARNQLRKEFKGEFGRQSFGGTGARRGRLQPEISEFMDWVRVSGAFKDAVGDSGTATRLASIANLTQPIQTAKKIGARRLIQFEADRLNIATPVIPE